MKSVELTVRGMTCNHCVHAISGSLRKIGATASIDLKSGTASVEYDENKTGPEQIIAAIEELGYVCA